MSGQDNVGRILGGNREFNNYRVVPSVLHSRFQDLIVSFRGLTVIIHYEEWDCTQAHSVCTCRSLHVLRQQSKPWDTCCTSSQPYVLILSFRRQTLHHKQNLHVHTKFISNQAVGLYRLGYRVVHDRVKDSLVFNSMRSPVG